MFSCANSQKRYKSMAPARFGCIWVVLSHPRAPGTVAKKMFEQYKRNSAKVFRSNSSISMLPSVEPFDPMCIQALHTLGSGFQHLHAGRYRWHGPVPISTQPPGHLPHQFFVPRFLITKAFDFMVHLCSQHHSASFLMLRCIAEPLP